MDAESDVRDNVDHLFRHKAGQMVSVLARRFGVEHIDLIEDAVQDAMIAAMRKWPVTGVPENPSAWLTQVAKNRVIDRLRHYGKWSGGSTDDEGFIEPAAPTPDRDGPQFEGELTEDQLRMIFACCSPEIPSDSQVALTLKVVSGFGVREISRAYLAKDEATAKMLTDLPTADLPYREIIGGIAPPDAQTLFDNDVYAYTGKVALAARLAHALRSGEPLGKFQDDGAAGPQIDYLRERVGRCGAATDPSIAMSNLVEIATQTLPYLAEDALRGVWIAPDWIECDAQAPELRTLLGLLDAIARRDGTAQQMLAVELLAKPGAVRAIGLRDWLLRAAMLGAIRARDFAAVDHLEAAYGASIPSGGSERAYRAWSINYAMQSRAAAEAMPAR